MPTRPPFDAAVGDLADLAVECRDGCGQHDDAALAAGIRRVLLHDGRRLRAHQQRAHEIDFDDLAEIIAGHRALLADELARWADAAHN